MQTLMDIFTNLSFWGAVLRIATPLILGTLGVLLCERAGVLNLGIEGIMVAGAFTGWLTVYGGHSLWTGVAIAALTGAFLGLLHAWLTVGLALSQHVSGLGITLLATALSSYAYRVSFPKVSTPPTIAPFEPMTALGIPVLDTQTPLTLLALLRHLRELALGRILRRRERGERRTARSGRRRDTWLHRRPWFIVALIVQRWRCEHGRRVEGRLCEAGALRCRGRRSGGST